MIALEKHSDPQFESLTLKELCFNIIHSAKSYGIKISYDLPLEEFKKFCKWRDEVMEAEKQELAELRAARYVKT